MDARDRSARRSRLPGLILRLGIVCLLVGSARAGTPPPRAIAQPLPVPPASTNPYWAGYVLTSNPGYVAVRATWIVPRIPCRSGSSHDATIYAWIGEGGYLQGISDPLIQAGTASDCFLGAPRYHAFYEWYPGIYATDFPIGIAAGDRITVSVVETRWGVWTLTARNDTNGQQSAVATTSAVDARSADFIVERPTVCAGMSCGQADLGRFKSVTFRDVQTLTAPGTAPRQTAIALIDAGRHKLAVPAHTPSLPRSYSVLWRAGR